MYLFGEIIVKMCSEIPRKIQNDRRKLSCKDILWLFVLCTVLLLIDIFYTLNLFERIIKNNAMCQGNIDFRPQKEQCTYINSNSKSWSNKRRN